jgi:drug/metabolite transporter (DMT)-like permease
MLVVMAIYAMNFVAIRYSILSGLTAFDLVALRFGTAGALMLPYLLRSGARDLGGVGWRRGVALACLAGAPYMLAFFSGLGYAPAGHGAVLNPGVIPLVVYAGLVVLGRRSFSLGTASSLFLIVIGLALVTQSSFSASPETLYGDVLLLVTGMCWGLFTLLLRVWEVKPLQAAAVVSVLSLAYLPVYAAVYYDGFSRVSTLHAGAQAFYQGVMNAVVALYLVTYAVGRIGAQLTSLFSPMVPVVTTVVAMPLLGEIPSPSQWVGVAVVVIGMLSAADIGGQR